MDVDEYDVDGGYFEDVSTLPSRGRLSVSSTFAAGSSASNQSGRSTSTKRIVALYRKQKLTCLCGGREESLLRG